MAGFDAFVIPELKFLLKKHGLSTKGTKPELKAELLKNGIAVPATVKEIEREMNPNASVAPVHRPKDFVTYNRSTSAEKWTMMPKERTATKLVALEDLQNRILGEVTKRRSQGCIWPIRR